MNSQLVRNTVLASVLVALFLGPLSSFDQNAQGQTTKPTPTATETYDVTKLSDVPSTHWAWPAVKSIYGSGIMEGGSGGDYQGDRPMTRIELVVTMARFEMHRGNYLSVPLLTTNDYVRSYKLINARAGKEFSDVLRTHWGYPALQRMSQYGIIQGFPNGTFAPNTPVSRYDYAVVLERMIAFINRDSYYFDQLENPQSADPPWKEDKTVPFKDLPTSHRAYRAVVRLWSAGIFKGDTQTSFQGSKPLSRYEIAASIERLRELIRGGW